MPKRKRKVDTSSNPGKHHQMLMMYADLPANIEELKNGHILYQKVQLANPDVLKLFKDTFNIVITNNILESLFARSVKKYRNMAREADKKKFQEICAAPVAGYVVAVGEVQNAQVESVYRCLEYDSSSDEEGTSTAKPVRPLPPVPESLKQASSIKSLDRKWLLLPLKKKILEREERMKKDTHLLKKKVIELRPQLSSKKYTQNRYLQRKISRLSEKLKMKDVKLKQKKSQLHNLKKNAVEKHILDELKNARRTIKRLKLTHKQCPSRVQFRKVTEEVRELRMKLKEKENSEAIIEDRLMKLEEELELLNSEEDVDLRDDGKTISCKARLLVNFMLDCGVATKRVPLLIQRVGWWFGFIPQRSTVDTVARELGVNSDLLASPKSEAQGRLLFLPMSCVGGGPA